jgi:hypothetical protein
MGNVGVAGRPLGSGRSRLCRERWWSGERAWASRRELRPWQVSSKTARWRWTMEMEMEMGWMRGAAEKRDGKVLPLRLQTASIQTRPGRALPQARVLGCLDSWGVV